MGVSHDGYGVFGHSKNNDTIHGETDSTTSPPGAGVWGESKGSGDGVHGISNGTGADQLIRSWINNRGSR